MILVSDLIIILFLKIGWIARVVDQLCVKVAVSMMGPPIVIETGLVVPEKEPVPLPVQLVKW